MQQIACVIHKHQAVLLCKKIDCVIQLTIEKFRL